MAVHHAVGISRQRNIGYRQSKENIMAQGLSTPDPVLSPTHLSIRRDRVSLMVSRNTTLVPSLGLHVGPACAAGLSDAYEGSVCHHRGERKKENKFSLLGGNITEYKISKIKFIVIVTVRVNRSNAITDRNVTRAVSIIAELFLNGTYSSRCSDLRARAMTIFYVCHQVYKDI